MDPSAGARPCLVCSTHTSGAAKRRPGLHSHSSRLTSQYSGQTGKLLRPGNGYGFGRGQDSALCNNSNSWSASVVGVTARRGRVQPGQRRLRQPFEFQLEARPSSPSATYSVWTSLAPTQLGRTLLQIRTLSLLASTLSPLSISLMFRPTAALCLNTAPLTHPVNN